MGASLTGPFWYRYYLDFLLIIPTYYSYLQMRARGSLATSSPAARKISIRIHCSSSFPRCL